MFRPLFFRFSLLSTALFLSACEEPRLSSREKNFDPAGVSDATSLQELLAGLGVNLPTQPPDSIADGQVDDGRALVFQGRLPDREDQKLSAYFYCADCHSTERETHNLAEYNDPLAKLAYAIEKDIVMLPAPSLAGIVNREGYFQSESAERFGAEKAVLNDLPAAIQFCSTTIARGRELDETELEAILAYLWSLEWRIGDLGFRGADLAELKRRALNPDEHRLIAEELKALYPLFTQSTVGVIPEDSFAGFDRKTDPDLESGAAVWLRSCIHCHGAGGASEHYFGDKPSTWRALQNAFREGLLYEHLRQGTFSKESRTAHMPSFSREKLSDAQVENLRAYIETKVSSEKPEN
ncbi:MAG: cytochrome c [Verrucomicrobiales bacterium]|nr:cytochrome c [Verrucomicrobiales bacterium]